MNPSQHAFKVFADTQDSKNLADIAGIHVSTLYKYKQGNAIPSDVLIRIANHFKCSTDKVLGRVLPAEALTKENFPTARPNVAFTVSAEQLDYEKQCRELKFNMEVKNKRIAELEQLIRELEANYKQLAETHKGTCATLTERTEERDVVARDRDKISEELRNTRILQNETVASTSPEISKYKALLSAIHVLSEEK